VLLAHECTHSKRAKCAHIALVLHEEGLAISARPAQMFRV
jgi:hypothetical protein